MSIIVAPNLYSQTIARVTEEHPLIGMALLRHRNARGQPISFLEQPFLVEWYCDFTSAKKHCDGADIVTVPQVGKTELNMQLMIHEAGWRGRLTAYAQPTGTARDGLVKNRLNPLLLEIQEYRRRLPARDLAALQRGETSSDTGSMRSKRFGSGTMLFISAQTDTDWVDYSVDTMIIDEYDICLGKSPLNVAKAPDRLRASPDPRFFRMGNPEIPRGGVELLWNQGDQRLWHWRCHHCGERQPITWLDSLVEREASGQWRIRDPEAHADPNAPIRPVCTRCHKPFERVADGAAWIPAYPSRPRRSYRTARYDHMSVPLRRAWREWIEAQSSTALMRMWWRGWEGIAWEPSSGGVSRGDLADAAILPRMDHDGGSQYRGRSVVAGIDVGTLFHVSVSETVRGAGGRVERRCIWVGTCQQPSQVHDILRRYHVRTAVIDAMPETRVAQSIRDDARKHYGTDVWLCRFAATDKTGKEEFGMRLEPKSKIVTVDRTQLLDAAADHIRIGGDLGRIYSEFNLTPPPCIPFDATPERFASTWSVLSSVRDAGAERGRLWPADALGVQGFTEQMQAPRRIFTADGAVRWDAAERPDHYRFADAYDLLATVLDRRGARLI